jgi:ribosome-binding ATPase YchF (GTP1/OBG family)
VDAERDRRELEAELVLADLEMVEKRLERIVKEKRGGQTAVQALQEKVLERCREALEGGKRLLHAVPLEEHERQTIVSLGLVSYLPWLWAFNVDEGDLRSPKWRGPDVFVMSARIEQEIMGLSDAEERVAYLREVGLESSGLDRLNRAAYDLLGLMSFYTVGKDEVRAWTVRKGARAPEAAGKVHSDMERGFIRVEVTKYDDLVAAGSEEAARKTGKEQVKGRDYVIQDGEICHFRFNV